MKKLLAVLVLGALLLSMTACFYENKKDPSASPLEEYTSGELRVLIEDAMEVAGSRFDDMGPDLAEALVENMHGLGYPLEITSIKDNDIRFVLEDEPSTEFMMLHHTIWLLFIDGDVTPAFLTDCLGSMAKALADVEGHPGALYSAGSYASEFTDALLIETLSPGQMFEYYYRGYLYSIKKNSDSTGYSLGIE